MRIEAIDRINATDDDGSEIHMAPGDIKTVGANFGSLACQMGWAKDTDGVVSTGERSTKRVVVTPDNIVVDQASK